MKKMRFALLVLASAMLCSVLVSCNKDYTGKEKTHPVFVKAGTAQNSGDYAEAAKLYEEFLLVAPKSAETHMRLAALYGDNLDSPLKAIYHYEKVIELRPDDTANNDNIRSFISVAKKKLFEDLKSQYQDTDKENAVKAELEATKKKLEDYKAYAAKLRAAYVQLGEKCRKALKYYQAANGKQRNAVSSAQKDKKSSANVKKEDKKVSVKAGNNSGKTSRNAAVAAKTPANNSGIIGKHTVKKGETLHSISRKYYGTSRYYKLIAEANKGKLPANLGVKAGQVLVIPQKPAK